LGKTLVAALEYSHTLEFDNTIYVYESEDDLEGLINNIKTNYSHHQKNNVSAMNVASCRVYQHSNYVGRELSRTGNFSIPDLKNNNFNDIISSTLVTNRSDRFYMVQYFEHNNYRGKATSIIVKMNSLRRSSSFRFYQNDLNDKVSSMTGRYL